jgi:hypothetical protein
MACSSFADSANHRGELSGPFRADELMGAMFPGLHPGLSHPAALRLKQRARALRLKQSAHALRFKRRARPLRRCPAPKGRTAIAQGNALGSMPKKIPSPEGAK